MRIKNQGYGIVVLIFAVWIPVFVMSSHAWRHGDYYDYGWYVPPLAALMFMRRWREMPEGWTMSRGAWWTGVLWMAPVWLACRILNATDPYWRVPQWLAALVALAASHLLLVRSRGTGASRSFLMVGMFALTAVPMPSVVENSLVQWLSEGVIEVTAEIFRVSGRPVQVWGHRMESLGEWVEVADGCSGIRSLQGFLMVSLFFGEWFRLGRLERCLMMILCLIAVWVANVVRALILAWLRFDDGKGMFDSWHDSISLLTFATVAAIAWWLASRLESDGVPVPLIPPRSAAETGVTTLPGRVVWVGLGLVLGLEVAAWAWMDPQNSHESASLEMRHPQPGVKFRLDVDEYQKALPTLRCTNGWMASIGEDLGDRKMRAGWFAWDSTDGSSVLDVYHHSPEKCMGAIGWELISRGQKRVHEGPGLRLTFNVTKFRDPALGTMVHVYKAVWFSSPRRPGALDEMGADDALRRLRLSLAWHRFRPRHARVLMGVVAGEENEWDAWSRFQGSLTGGLYLQAPEMIATREFVNP